MRLPDGRWRVTTTDFVGTFVVSKGDIVECDEALRADMKRWLHIAEWIGPVTVTLEQRARPVGFR